MLLNQITLELSPIPSANHLLQPALRLFNGRPSDITGERIARLKAAFPLSGPFLFHNVGFINRGGEDGKSVAIFKESKCIEYVEPLNGELEGTRDFTHTGKNLDQ